MRFFIGKIMNGSARNSPCFCGSGLKYKKCHLIIENKVQTEKYVSGRKVQLHEMKKLFDETLYPEICIAKEIENNCSDQIINAHTLTKSLSLNEIAKNGHVYGFKNRDIFDLARNEGFTSLKKLGVRTASTFKGFCSYHDDKLFSCLEKQNFELLEEQSAALLYRAFALEIYKKKTTLAHARKSFKTLLDSFSSGQVNRGSEFLISNLKRAKLDFEDMHYLNEILINLLNEEKYSKIRSYALKLNFKIPFICTGLFAIYRDVNHEIIQDIFDYSLSKMSYTALNIFYAKDGSSWLILNWLDTCDEINLKIINQIQKFNVEDQVNILGNLMISYTENSYFSMEYIDNLKPNLKENIEKNFNGTFFNQFKRLTEPNFIFENLNAEIKFIKNT